MFFFSKKFTTSNNETFYDLNQKNYFNTGIINDINSYENSSLFPDEHAFFLNLVIYLIIIVL